MQRWEKTQAACNTFVLATIQLNSLINEVKAHDKAIDFVGYREAVSNLADHLECLVNTFEDTLLNVRNSIDKDAQELMNAD